MKVKDIPLNTSMYYKKGESHSPDRAWVLSHDLYTTKRTGHYWRTSTIVRADRYTNTSKGLLALIVYRDKLSAEEIEILDSVTAEQVMGNNGDLPEDVVAKLDFPVEVRLIQARTISGLWDEKMAEEREQERLDRERRDLAERARQDRLARMREVTKFLGDLRGDSDERFPRYRVSELDSARRLDVYLEDLELLMEIAKDAISAAPKPTQG